MSAIATPEFRQLLKHLLNGNIRQATVSRAEAADEFLLLSEEDQKLINAWLLSRQPPAKGRQAIHRLLDEHFPIRGLGKAFSALGLKPV